MSEVKFDIDVEQMNYDEDKKPLAYAAIKADSKAEAVRCLQSLIDSLEQIPHVADPNG